MTKDIELTWWQRLADLFYDFSAAIISIVDVVTDILITIEFYLQERWAFFWIAIVIFGLAQFCYSGLFTIAYAESLKTKFQMLVFVCVFPVAQLVPAFIWVDSYNLPFTKAILKFCKLDTNAFNEKECPPDKDELQFWIEQKFLSHGGFVIEAVIEAFPQSILQMIALVMFEEVGALNVFSIVLSMTSVASKTIMFCYSIDRITFLFNFLCMSADIFGIFCTLSWVFYHPDNTGDIRTLGWIWIWKIIVVSIACVVGGFFMLLTLFLVEISHDCIHNNNRIHITWRDIVDCWKEICKGCYKCWKYICQMIFSSETWRNIFEALDQECCSCPDAWKNFKSFLEGFAILIAGSIYVLMFPIAGIFLYCVAMMVLEIVKLSLLPLIFRNIDDKHRSNVRFYKPVFKWLLNSTNTRDYHLRLAVANAYCCEDYLENVQTSNKKGTWKSNKFMSWLLKSADPNDEIEKQKEKEEKEKKEKEEKDKKAANETTTSIATGGLLDAANTNNNSDDNDDEKDDEKVGSVIVTTITSTKGNDGDGNETKNNDDNNDNDVTITTGNNDDKKQDNVSKEEKKQEEDEEEEEPENGEIDAIARLLQKTGAGPDSIATDKLENKNNDEPGISGIGNKIDETDTILGGMENWNNSDPLTALGFSGFDIENIIEFRRRPPLLPPDRLQFDYTHLLSVTPADLRLQSDWSFKFFAEKYMSFFKEVFDENFERDWEQAGCCGRTIIIVILIVLGTALYVVVPIIILYVFGSLVYPLVCLIVTPWEQIALLQLVLTTIYLSAITILLLISFRVYKFQHANFHFIAVRENWWYSRSLDAPFQIQKRYVDLIATRIRNNMINTFFGDLSHEMMTFLPPLHEVDEEWVEKVEINVDYEPEFDYALYDYSKKLCYN